MKKTSGHFVATFLEHSKKPDTQIRFLGALLSGFSEGPSGMVDRPAFNAILKTATTSKWPDVRIAACATIQ
ncbi:MAG: hypothetical protein ABL897_03760, partial [Hyphomicrobium sp.]